MNTTKPVITQNYCIASVKKFDETAYISLSYLFIYYYLLYCDIFCSSKCSQSPIKSKFKLNRLYFFIQYNKMNPWRLVDDIAYALIYIIIALC